MEIGTKGAREITVTEDMCASKAGKGLPPVLSTPNLISNMEGTCLDSVMPFLEEGQATVGAKVDITHMAATPVGMKVFFESELLEAEGAKLVFSVTARDEVETVGKGTHVRFIIDQQGFIDNLAKKQK
ncbi:MAG: thioesterase family protein [Firmicutes bacterium]|nr:thioesterase family protein [Bacillota bacterium]